LLEVLGPCMGVRLNFAKKMIVFWGGIELNCGCELAELLFASNDRATAII
jgi:hypothetical protein